MNTEIITEQDLTPLFKIHQLHQWPFTEPSVDIKMTRKAGSGVPGTASGTPRASAKISLEPVEYRKL